MKPSPRLKELTVSREVLKGTAGGTGLAGGGGHGLQTSLTELHFFRLHLHKCTKSVSRLHYYLLTFLETHFLVQLYVPTLSSSSTKHLCTVYLDMLVRFSLIHITMN